MNKLQIALIFFGILLIVGGIFLLTFTDIFKHVYAVISILIGAGLVIIMSRSNKK